MGGREGALVDGVDEGGGRVVVVVVVGVVVCQGRCAKGKAVGRVGDDAIAVVGVGVVVGSIMHVGAGRVGAGHFGRGKGREQGGGAAKRVNVAKD